MCLTRTGKHFFSEKNTKNVNVLACTNPLEDSYLTEVLPATELDFVYVWFMRCCSFFLTLLVFVFNLFV